jgi:signal transduction histidine kinase
MEDDEHSFWLNMDCALVRIPRPELDSWVEDSSRTVQAMVFDSSDGVKSHAFYGDGSPRVGKSADGRIWFSTWDGLSVVDPRHLPVNKLPPPVHVEKVIVDGKNYDVSPGLRLPPRINQVEIDYTALSFVATEKVHFRFKLEGEDHEWQEVGTRRQAFYTNLSPGSYRFRVVASNNSGVWNEAGAALEFSIAPAYYQTRWFTALVVAGVFAVLSAGYLGRVRHIARDYQRRLDERVNERTRIARELHDTLLQGFQGLLLWFQTASNLLPESPAAAKERLDSAIGHAAKAIAEGRDAVQGLRASSVEGSDLAVAIRVLGDELVTHTSTQPPPTFNVAIEGQKRDLHPVVRDEVYKITAEALRNAVRHAHAGRVEVEIRYDTGQFRLRVRDDGKGIDPGVLAHHGREGHYGLRGMPERAALIGGKLAVWSDVGAGTEVELRLPARIAFATSRRRSWLSKLLASKTPAQSEENTS